MKRSIADLIDLERLITNRFMQRSLPFLNRSLTDEWDKLFLMQHYGVPTRLLDWSENPFVSIYFALLDENKTMKRQATLWMCNPAEWNRAALSHVGFKGGILDPSETPVRSYSPGVDAGQMPNFPIMIYGSYNSPRIVAQRGGFALFGQGMKSMESVYESGPFPSGILKRVVIPRESVAEIRKSLFRKGFTESVVFPDLEGLAKELRRHFGFGEQDAHQQPPK
jgi:hypothetical protein